MIDLSDAKALLARAESGYAEFEQMVGPRKTWRVQADQDPATGDWTYSIEVNRAVFDEARFLIAASASYIASALDHVAAAIARANGHERARLYFPFGLTDEEFEKRLREAEKFLGRAMCEVLGQARDEQRMNVIHVQAVKQVANDGKHWELRTVVMGAAGIASISQKFEKRYFGVPQDAFLTANSYEFHRGDQLDASLGWELLLGQTIHGLKEGLPSSIWGIFNCSFRFARGVIDRVEGASK
jgi:hypothetical protein